MTIPHLLILCLFVVIQGRPWTDAYKIDFEKGDNKIHLESAKVENGKLVNEPKLEEAIKTLSGFKFNKLNKDANKNLKKFENEIEDRLTSNENSRIFITNINKNINTNEDGDSSGSTGEKEKTTIISGHGNAQIVGSSGGGKKTPSYAKPLKATRPIHQVSSQDEAAQVKERTHESVPVADEAAASNLAKIVPELIENPLWFINENVTTTV